MRIRGGTLVVKTLKSFGVKRLFSLPGHQILSIYDACIDEDIPVITTRHEAAAVYMAEATSYARRGIGVVILAGGPEITNALTGIAKAYYANTPLLVISGTNTMKKLDRGFPQDMDQLTVVRPFTKWARGCYDAGRIPEYIAEAYRHALRGRPGPAYLEIPYDLLEASVPAQLDLPEKPGEVRPLGDTGPLQDAADMVGSASKPILIAGSGAFWSNAEPALLRFHEQTNIPLFLTNSGISMQLPAGVVAGYGTPGAGRFSMEAIARADLIILLGTRMNFPLGFGREPFMSSGQRVIQVDIEPSEIGRYREVDLGIQGDVSACLDWWTDRGIQMQPMEKWLAEIEKSRTNFERKLKPLKLSNRKPIHPLRLVQDIADSRSDDSILCLDGANSLLWNFNITDRPPEGQTIISPIGELESIGAGIPHALAMKLEHPDREVILHVGDGSFGYHAMEFETAVRYGIPIVCIVHNDRGWGMTRDMQMDFFGSDREIGNTLGDVRYDLLVESLGGYGELVNSPEDIAPAIGRAIYSGLPACVNVMVDPEPKSPGLAMFMLLEMMLGQETVYDKIPDIVRKFERLHLDGMISKLMLKYVDRMLHRAMK